MIVNIIMYQISLFSVLKLYTYKGSPDSSATYPHMWICGILQLLCPLERSISCYQENLKGESVVAAILLSRMEVSYCTSRFFEAKQFR